MMNKAMLRYRLAEAMYAAASPVNAEDSLENEKAGGCDGWLSVMTACSELSFEKVLAKRCDDPPARADDILVAGIFGIY